MPAALNRAHPRPILGHVNVIHATLACPRCGTAHASAGRSRRCRVRLPWETVPGTSFTCSGNQSVGHWQADHRIWIAESYLEDEMVVRHEMLHELIGHSGHPNPPFGKGCPLTWATWNGTED
jgi:hypothetical protein